MTKEKSQAELEIESLADVFNIAGDGFEAYYKKAKKKNKGNSSSSASSGDSSHSASSGDSSHSASSGNSSSSASSGYSSRSASSGNSSSSASSGDYSKSECAGTDSACAAVGYRGAVRGDIGNGIAAFEYDGKALISGKADLVDGKIIKAQQWYIVEGGSWVAVDYTDGIFSRVLSNKAGVKKVKTDEGKVLFIVSDDNGNSAHGETIKEARESLIYKNVSKFDGKLPAKATGTEWVGIYRAVTGACSAGVKMFVDGTGKSLGDVYTAKQIAQLVEGHYGAEKFAEKLKGK